jgi:hypothetical protein
MPSNRQMAEHLLSCFDAIYLTFGEGAPKVSNDTFVVRSHELSRAYGSLALGAREHLGGSDVEPMAVLEGVLRFAFDHDETGAMAMFAFAVVVGPRLLVSLLDARGAMADDEGLRALWDHASDVTVVEVRAVGECVKGQSPIDDPSWQLAARDLVTTLEAAGNAESLGLSR